VDTGVFDEGRYFDVFVEYAKATAEDLLIEITIANRGPEAATLHVLPTLWFRNTWSWGENVEKPLLEFAVQTDSLAVVAANDPKLGQRYFYCDGSPKLLFTENDTNTERLFGVPNATPFVKDGINNCVGRGESGADGNKGRGSVRHQRRCGRITHAAIAAQRCHAERDDARAEGCSVRASVR
jgi:hypothetical protein